MNSPLGAMVALTLATLGIPAAQRSLPTEPANYYNSVAHLMKDRCVSCHRAGGSAPFSLETYQDVSSRSRIIADAVRSKRMPPWFAAPPDKGKPSVWANDPTLNSAQKSTLLEWIAGSKPAGNAQDAPSANRYDAQWRIGKPDAVFRIPEEYTVPADGILPYVISESPTLLAEDRWVQALEVRPTGKGVVHHVLVFVVPAGKSRTKTGVGEPSGQSGADDEGGGFLCGYVPGNSHVVYPEGLAKRLPAGCRLRFQIHYTTAGKATEDRTEVGVRYASAAPKFEVRAAGIANPFLSIPPGAANHLERAEIPVDSEVKLLAFMPHMHMRGKSCSFSLIGPDGSRSLLLDIPKFDFNWQLYYRLAEPRTAPVGSKVEFAGIFDNSAKNPANPDPKKTVRWGAQTFEEMLLGYLEFYVERKDGAAPVKGLRSASSVNSALLERLFRGFDKNGDGRATQAELGERWIRFKKADADHDGALTLAEVRAFLRPP